MDSSSESQLMELSATPTSYEDLLDAQRDLFQNQMEKLQELVAVQCKLTGINPLSQEMAAGALSIKIGKRPRDLMNPKAIKYMQYVFSIKDSINKRESREISARFGVTVTQVRDFFTSQRSRVRKFARLYGEKVDVGGDLITSTSGSNMPLHPIPLNVVISESTDEGPSNSKRRLDMLSKMEESDFQFTKNIFSSMRKEETFGEQVKLLRWILRIKNPSVLDWFLIEGGLMILATWLTEAAEEEQTSFLKVIMKVLHYLPLSNALPAHVSAILQSVNRLRFYRLSDISHRARVLLSNWSKIFGKSLSSKKNNGLKSASYLQDEMLLKRSIREVMGNESSWDLKDENSEASMGLPSDNPDKLRASLPAPPPMLLTAAGDESNKKWGGLPFFRERRKVQILEQPGQKSSLRNPGASKTAPAAQNRPLSADDIQKAKMRAQFMQSKYGKGVGSSSSVEKSKPENQNRSDVSAVNSFPKSSYPENGIEQQKKIENAESRVTDRPESRAPPMNVEEPPMKKSKKDRIPWMLPPEMKMSEEWHVACGESSKEVEIQNNRNRREREAVYRSPQEVPPNPREPWDREMDHDDSLTPEIPTEQLPDVEPSETPSSVPPNDVREAVVAAPPAAAAAAAPDFELLAALLKNPELVFALTSGKTGATVSSEDTVKLLDMIKSSGPSSSSNPASGIGSTPVVSLPSPTPLSDSAPPIGGVKPPPRNPFSRQQNLPEYHQILPLRPQQQQQLGGYSSSLNPLIHHHHQQNHHHHLLHQMMAKPSSSSSSNSTTLWPGSSNTTPLWTPPPSHNTNPPPPPPLPPYVSGPPNPFEKNLSGQYQNPPHVGGNWRNNAGPGGYESWSPENSPTRRQHQQQRRQYEYFPGQYYGGGGGSESGLMQEQQRQRSAAERNAAMMQMPSIYRDRPRYLDRR